MSGVSEYSNSAYEQAIQNEFCCEVLFKFVHYMYAVLARLCCLVVLELPRNQLIAKIYKFPS
jgi:hypothetical protein